MTVEVNQSEVHPADINYSWFVMICLTQWFVLYFDTDTDTKVYIAFMLGNRLKGILECFN